MQCNVLKDQSNWHENFERTLGAQVLKKPGSCMDISDKIFLLVSLDLEYVWVRDFQIPQNLGKVKKI